MMNGRLDKAPPDCSGEVKSLQFLAVDWKVAMLEELS